MGKKERKPKIALLIDIFPLIDEKFFKGGGGVVERELSKEMLSLWDNVYLIPKVINIYSILENRYILQELLNSRIKDRVLGIECLNPEISLAKYLTCITQELRNDNYFLFDLNYIPGLDYQTLISKDKSLKSMPLFDRISLRLGEIVYLMGKTRTKGAVLLQGIGPTKIRLGIPITVLKNNFYRFIRRFPVNIFFNFNSEIKYVLRTGTAVQLVLILLIINPKIVRIYGVSEGQLANLGIQHFKKSKAFLPPFGIRKNLLQYDIVAPEKENYGIFFTRFVPSKGILEIPYIIKEIVKEKKDFVIRIAGKFYENTENIFFNEVKKLGIENNIDYVGFLEGKKLAEYIRHAKVFIYPTHEDTFGLVILESIYFKTPVVTYDILGPKSVFKDVPIVKFVKEYEYKKMAREVLKILNMSDEEYYSFISNKKIDEFTEKFKDWKSIASQYYNDFMSLAQTKEIKK